MKTIQTITILLAFFSCIAGASGIGDDPRPFHYDFAHKLLPRMFFRGSPVFEEKMKLDGSEILYDLWEFHLGKHSLTKEEYPISIESHKNGHLQIIVISLPSPQHVTEAHMIACVFQDSGVKSYYTLEQSISFDPSVERNVFGAWTKSGSHLNFGEGPVAKVDKFLNAIIDKER